MCARTGGALLVDYVSPGSAAAKAGLRPKMLVWSFQDARVAPVGKTRDLI